MVYSMDEVGRLNIRRMLRIKGSKDGECIKQIIKDDHLSEIITRIMMDYHVDRDEALRKLLEMGARYYSLSKTYGEAVDRRELWDRRFYYMNVEAGYLYYRYRLGEVINDFEHVLRLLSTLVGELENCYKKCEDMSIEKAMEKVREFQENVIKYFNEYIEEARKDLNQEKYVSDKEVLKSIKAIIRKYEETLRKK